MLFDDLTRKVTYEALQRYWALNDGRSDSETELAGQLYDNTVQPKLPQTMKQDLKAEYKDTFTPIPLGRLIVNKISNAMYGRSVERTTGSEEMDKQWARMLGRISMTAPIACRACSTYGDAAIRVVPNWRGLTLTLYTGKMIRPIYDPEAPDDWPVGLIYKYEMQSPTNQILSALKMDS